MRNDAVLNSLERPPEAEDTEPLEEGGAEREPLPLQIRIEPRPPLPLGVRIGIFIVGWLLILVGAALLSLDNELAYRGLRRVCARWPHLWRRIENFREKAHDRIHRTFHRKS